MANLKLTSQISAKSDIGFSRNYCSKILCILFHANRIDKVNEEHWQNVLININFCQYCMTKPSYYFDLTEFWSETLPMCSTRPVFPLWPYVVKLAQHFERLAQLQILWKWVKNMFFFLIIKALFNKRFWCKKPPILSNLVELAQAQKP